jgi:hypothetical protein
MNHPNPPQDSLLVSYLLLRKLIGLLGVALPFVLAIGAALLSGLDVQDSVSAYYYTVMRDVFVGILFAIAVFMFTYQGYDRQDNIVGNVACSGAIGVALFPVAPATGGTLLQENLGMLHYLSATVFFLMLAWFSLVLFRKTNPAVPPTPEKLRRNRVYYVCGVVILAAIGMIALVKLVPGLQNTVFLTDDPVFWLEALAVVAFGFSWLVKGEAILADHP